MKLLPGSNAYSVFMRGAPQVRDLMQTAEEVLFPTVVVGGRSHDPG